MPARDPGESILVVDDAPDTLEIVRRNLSAAGYRLLTASGAAEALEIVRSCPVDLVITDMKMPRVSGLDLVRHVRDNLPDTEVMMITGYATVNGAVEAVKAGAEEYLAKPFTDGELVAAVRRALDKLRLRRAARTRPAAGPTRGMIGESAPMRAVHAAIGKAARAMATVLITGESGTGKELVARAIHYSGARAAAPFVPVNCGGIPEGLLESELFGHMRGAFTGASDSRAGFFQTAGGGTIFLDEVGETSLAMQVKLLRALQDGEVCMVGSNRPRKVDVRILAATNRDLLALVRKGTFREDLYYRLNVVTIAVPPLRERGDDVVLLARAFAERYAAEAGRSVPVLSDRVLRVFMGYSWPGNVRELQNVVQRLVVMSEGQTVEASDLPELMRGTARVGTDTARTLAEVEAVHIRNVLTVCGGNRSKTAQVLGIDRKTLRNKLLTLNLPAGGEFRPGGE